MGPPTNLRSRGPWAHFSAPVDIDWKAFGEQWAAAEWSATGQVKCSTYHPGLCNPLTVQDWSRNGLSDVAEMIVCNFPNANIKLYTTSQFYLISLGALLSSTGWILPGWISFSLSLQAPAPLKWSPLVTLDIPDRTCCEGKPPKHNNKNKFHDKSKSK